MKRFRFPLRPVAVLRAHRELRAREAFAAAVQACAQAEEHLAGVRARIADLEEVLFAGRNGSFSAADASAHFRHYRAECQAVVTAERAVGEARAARQKRRDEYVEASRQLEIVHRLEEKALGAHRVEQARAEQHELDEFAGFAAARRAFLP